MFSRHSQKCWRWNKWYPSFIWIKSICTPIGCIVFSNKRLITFTWSIQWKTWFLAYVKVISLRKITSILHLRSFFFCLLCEFWESSLFIYKDKFVLYIKIKAKVLLDLKLNCCNSFCVPLPRNFGGLRNFNGSAMYIGGVRSGQPKTDLIQYIRLPTSL